MNYTNYSQILSDTIITNMRNDSNAERMSFLTSQHSHLNGNNVHLGSISRQHRICIAENSMMNSLSVAPIPEETKEQLESIYILEGFPSDDILLDLSDFLQIGIYSLKHWFNNRHAEETGIEDSMKRSPHVAEIPDEMKEQLESIYNLEGYPTDNILMDLSNFLQIGAASLKLWFDHKHTG